MIDNTMKIVNAVTRYRQHSTEFEEYSNIEIANFMTKKMFKFSNERLQHSLQVTNVGIAFATDRNIEVDYDLLYLILMFHDIGFTEDPVHHETAGRQYFLNLGFPEGIANIIGMHSLSGLRHVESSQLSLPPQYKVYLDILDYADMSVSGTGEKVTFDQRLKDIEERYGSTSKIYLSAIKQKERAETIAYDY